MVTLLSRDMKPAYEYLEVCTSGENSELEPRDYASRYRNTPLVEESTRDGAWGGPWGKDSIRT